MKARTFLLLLVFGALPVFASNGPTSTSNGFDANNQAEFSGYQNYTQNNYSDGDHYRINGVKCPVPTMFVGGNAQKSIYEDTDPKNLGLAVGVQIPLFTGRCESAAKLEIRKMQWSLQDAEHRSQIEDERHRLEKAKLCAILMQQGYKLSNKLCKDVRRDTSSRSLQQMTDQLFAK